MIRLNASAVPDTCALRAHAPVVRLRALAAFSWADNLRAAALTSTARSAGRSRPVGSPSRSSRAKIAARAASDWSSLAMPGSSGVGRDLGAQAALLRSHAASPEGADSWVVVGIVGAVSRVTASSKTMRDRSVRRGTGER
jgi:hypothetical protein